MPAFQSLQIYDIYCDIYHHSVPKKTMNKTAKVFMTGRSQAVRLPQEFRFQTDEIYIRRDPFTGDVVLSERPGSWAEFFTLDQAGSIPADFMSEADRLQATVDRDPFAG